MIEGVRTRVDHLHQPVVERSRIAAPAVVGFAWVDLDAPLLDSLLAHSGHELRGGFRASFEVDVDDLHTVAHSDDCQPQKRDGLTVARLADYHGVPLQFRRGDAELTGDDPLVEVTPQEGTEGLGRRRPKSAR